jgi:hypothetical protein
LSQRFGRPLVDREVYCSSITRPNIERFLGYPGSPLAFDENSLVNFFAISFYLEPGISRESDLDLNGLVSARGRARRGSG